MISEDIRLDRAMSCCSTNNRYIHESGILVDYNRTLLLQLQSLLHSMDFASFSLTLAVIYHTTFSVFISVERANWFPG